MLNSNTDESTINNNLVPNCHESSPNQQEQDDLTINECTMNSNNTKYNHSKICKKFRLPYLKGGIILLSFSSFNIASLVLPLSFTLIGLLPGLILYLIISLSQLVSSIILLSSSMRTRLIDVEMWISNTLNTVFSTIYKGLYPLSLIFYMIFLQIIVIELSAKAINDYFPHQKTSEQNGFNSKYLWIIIWIISIFLLQLPLSSLVSCKDKKVSKILGFVASGTILCFYIKAIILLPFNFSVEHIKLFEPISIDYLYAFAIVWLALSNQHKILGVVYKIKLPTERRGTRIIILSFFYNFILFLTFIISVYINHHIHKPVADKDNQGKTQFDIIEIINPISLIHLENDIIHIICTALLVLTAHFEICIKCNQLKRCFHLIEWNIYLKLPFILFIYLVTNTIALLFRKQIELLIGICGGFLVLYCNCIICCFIYWSVNTETGTNPNINKTRSSKYLIMFGIAIEFWIVGCACVSTYSYQLYNVVIKGNIWNFDDI